MYGTEKKQTNRQGCWVYLFCIAAVLVLVMWMALTYAAGM